MDSKDDKDERSFRKGDPFVHGIVDTMVDSSPHGIAVISIKDPDKGADVCVAWYDQNRTLVFSKEFPEIYPAALGNKTVEIISLDFKRQFGDRADATAKLFLAQLEKNAGNTSNEGVIRAIEGVDNVFGVDIKPLLEKGWHSFNKDHPEDAKAVAKLLVKNFMEVDVSPEVAVNMLSVAISTAPILPKTFLEKALLSLWADLQKASPSTANTLAETLGVPPENVASAISQFADKMAPSPTAWATQNSKVVYNLDKGGVHEKLTGNQGVSPSDVGNQEVSPSDVGNQGVSPSDVGNQGVSPSDDVATPGKALMGQIHQGHDARYMIKTAVDASPTKVAIIGVKGGSGFGSVDYLNTDTYDHVLVAYYDEIKKDYVIAEMTPNQEDRQGYLGGRNDPGTLRTITSPASQWHKYVAVSLQLTPEQTLLFKSSLLKHMGDRYSFIAQQGNSCAVLVMKALMDAGVWDWKDPGGAFPWAEKIVQALGRAGFNVIHPGTLLAWAAGKGGQVFDSETFVKYPPALAEVGGQHLAGGNAQRLFDSMALLAFSSDANATSSHEDRGSGQAVTDDEEGASPSKQVATASDDEDARGDDAAQQAEADDDEEASQEQVALASDPEHARLEDAAQQPETDDDEEASQEEVVLASDVTRSDDDASQQRTTDDDEDASQEEVAIAPDAEDAPTDDAAVMETAKAEEASVNSTGDDEAAAAPGQPATPASADMEEGFSFTAFAKQGATVEAAKEAMPAEQPSPEAIPGSGAPGSESAHPDLDSANVGNAAPGHERVVHHGDLAP
jgi:hypothetical protein